jgi:hypothetical protein
VTLHHNWFDGTIQRNPRVRYATVHCYNNYHVGNSTYSVASACDANVLVENCYFKNCPVPLQVGVPGFSPAGFLVQKGCHFENSGTPQLKYKDMTGLFPYKYELDSVMYVPVIAENYVGASKPSRTPNAVNVVKSDHASLSFSVDRLTFKSDITCPAAISVLGVDGRLLDIPFRGWIEGGVENHIDLNLTPQVPGTYIIQMQTSKGVSSLKILR